MIKRYYYDDPLAAAWMAKHFGMKFGLKYQGKMVWDCRCVLPITLHYRKWLNKD